jgi:ubiquitin-conjugating enzyme E2 D/E
VNKFYKIIKYNKNFQQKININIEDSLKDYLCNIKIKGDLMTNTKYIQNLMNNKMTSFLKLLFSKKSREPNESDSENNSKLFLIKYKGFKINDYPLLSDFESKSLEEKIIILEYNQCYYKYSLNKRNIELIYLINEFREKNNMNKFMSNKNVNLDEFLREKNSNDNKNYLFINPLGEFKNKLSKNDKSIAKILLIEDLRYIMVLEREKHEYIFIYSKNNEETNVKINIKYDKRIFQFYKFHLFNNIIPIVNIKNSPKYIKRNLKSLLKDSFLDEGYQILYLKNDTLIGVLEGPPETSFEKGYFLFKIIFSEDFPFKPPKFIFMTEIFHPNVFENGLVSVDILYDQWSPVLCYFSPIIYSIQSLLNVPNPDDFLNEAAAKLYKEDKNL